MGKAKRIDPLVQLIERSLAPGSFISYDRSWDFVRDLEPIKEQLDALAKSEKAGDAARAIELYELFLAGCYDKANELDDSGGNLSMFFQELFVGWITARQRARADAQDTVCRILRWIDRDEMGFCYEIEGDVAKALNHEGLGHFKAELEKRLDTALAPQKDAPRRRLLDFPWNVRRTADALRAVYLARGNLKPYVALCERFIPSPKDCENIATLCKARKRFADALEWIDRGLQAEAAGVRGNEGSYQLRPMRREILAKLGRRKDAFESAWADFAAHPSLFGYDNMMKYVPRNKRSFRHAQALDQASKCGLSGFIEICAATREWDRLADHVLTVDHRTLEGISHYVTEKAAEGLIRKHPQAAAKIYRALALRILAAGKAKYYDFALEHLRTTKRLLEKLNKVDEWHTIVDEIRRDHPRKRGFMSDFEKLVAGSRQESPKTFARLARRRWKELTSE